MQDYRHTEFAPATQRGVYLNHAGVSPAPARVVRAVTEAAEFSARDPLGYFLEDQMALSGLKSSPIAGQPCNQRMRF